MCGRVTISVETIGRGRDVDGPLREDHSSGTMRPPIDKEQGAARCGASDVVGARVPAQAERDVSGPKATKHWVRRSVNPLFVMQTN